MPHSSAAYYASDGDYVLGSIAVKGDGQAGSTLTLQAYPGEYFPKGRVFTLITETGTSAHIITEDRIADVDGEVELPFWPMLWRPPADGDLIEFAQPFLDGFVVADGAQSFRLFAAVLTEAFTVEEG